MADVEPTDTSLRLTPDLHLRHWGPDTLVYDPNRGDTHLLCGEAAVLLRHIEAGFSPETSHENLVNELQGLGLIEQAGS